MKKIVFKGSPLEGFSLNALLKEVGKISYRMRVVLEGEKCVELYDVSDEAIDVAIDLVSKHFKIECVDIDNISSMCEEKASETVISKDVSNVEENESLGNIDFSNIRFREEYPHIEELTKKMLATVYSIIYKKNVPEKEIGMYIQSATSNMYINYFGREIPEIAIGDVVNVTYGTQLPGEINGANVAGIVCDFMKPNMVFIVPITKDEVKDITSSRSYMRFNAPNDVMYSAVNYKGGTALLDKGKYVRMERVKEVIGKTNLEFFEEMLFRLAGTFDFTENLGNDSDEEESESPEFAVEDIEDVADEEFETSEASIESCEANEEEFDEVCAANLDVEDSHVETCESEEVAKENDSEIEEKAADSKSADDTVSKSKSDTKAKRKPLNEKNVNGETAIYETFKDSFEKLGAEKPTKEQLEIFLNEIGMTDSKFVKMAIEVSCNLEKISYETIIPELHKLNPNIRDEIIKASLQEDFKRWFENNPDFATKFQRLSIVALLKVFSKRYANKQ